MICYSSWDGMQKSERAYLEVIYSNTKITCSAILSLFLTGVFDKNAQFTRYTPTFRYLQHLSVLLIYANHPTPVCPVVPLLLIRIKCKFTDKINVSFIQRFSGKNTRHLFCGQILPNTFLRPNGINSYKSRQNTWFHNSNISKLQTEVGNRQQHYDIQ